jgi:hypothetical protein
MHFLSIFEIGLNMLKMDKHLSGFIFFKSLEKVKVYRESVSCLKNKKVLKKRRRF